MSALKSKVKDPAAKKRHNKQHDTRAASFIRIGKSLRVRAINSRRAGDAPIVATTLKAIAEELSAEGKYLRTLR